MVRRRHGCAPILVGAAVAWLGPAAARAQVCEGLPSLREHPVELGASYSRSSPDWALGGSLTWGRAAFVSVAGGYAAYPGMNYGLPQPGSAHSTVLHLGGGYEISPGRTGAEGTFGFCPAAYIEYETGPDGAYSGTRADASALTIGAGAGVGAVLGAQGSVRVIPYLAMALVRAHAGSVTMESGGFRAPFRDASTEVGGLLDVGAGIVIGALTVGPSASFPIGFKGAAASYGVAVSLAVGTGPSHP